LGGIGKDLEWNNIDSYRRKGSLLIQTLYLWDLRNDIKKREGKYSYIRNMK